MDSNLSLSFSYSNPMDTLIRGIFRGLTLRFSFIAPHALSRTAVRTVVTRDGLSCYTLSESTRVMDAVSQALVFWDTIGVSFVKALDCSDLDYTCIGSFESLVPACADISRGTILPENVASLYKIFGVSMIVDYILQLSSREAESQAFALIRSLMNRTLSSIVYDFPLKLITDCSSDLSTYVSYAKSVEEIGTLTSLSCMAIVWRRLACRSSVSSNFSILIDLNDSTEQNITSSVLDYILNSDGLALPEVRRIDPPHESYLVNLSNMFALSDGSFSLDSVSGIIGVSSTGLLSDVSVRLPPPPSCTPTIPEPVSYCEEIPSYICDSYDGCWIAWGPCQSVSPGYYSPRGTINTEIPCPNALAPNQVYTPNDLTHVCQVACLTVGQLFINGTCQALSPGRISRQTCDGSTEIIQCPQLDGVVFTDGGSCSGRYLSVALGSFRVISPQGFTIEAWVRINTLSMSAGGGGNIVPIYGFFGSAFLGIQYVDESSIALTAFVMTGTDVAIYSCPRLDHFKNTQWYHLAISWSDTGHVYFFKDGSPISNISTLAFFSQKSVSMLANSLLSRNGFAQLQTHLNREHFGPFRLTASDLVSNLAIHQNPWSAYLVRSYPNLDLFRPQMHDFAIEDSYELSFYGLSPPGYREKVDAVIPDATKSIFACKNVCLGKPITCAPPCDDAIWNPIACVCEKRITSCETTNPSSTVDAAATSSESSAYARDITTELPSKTADTSSQKSYTTVSLCNTATSTVFPISPISPDYNDAIGCILFIAFLVGALSIYLIRKRRVHRISSDDRSSHVFSLPEEDGWFTNVTVANHELFLSN